MPQLRATPATVVAAVGCRRASRPRSSRASCRTIRGVVPASCRCCSRLRREVWQRAASSLAVAGRVGMLASQAFSGPIASGAAGSGGGAGGQVPAAAATCRVSWSSSCRIDGGVRASRCLEESPWIAPTRSNRSAVESSFWVSWWRLVAASPARETWWRAASCPAAATRSAGRSITRNVACCADRLAASVGARRKGAEGVAVAVPSLVRTSTSP